MTPPTSNPSAMSQELSEEKLREILDGCEGVQGGPWQLDKFACYVWAPSENGGDFPLMDDFAKNGRVAEMRGWGYYTGHGSGALKLDKDEAIRRTCLTGEHIARLDPQTVAALVTALLSAQRKNEELVRALTRIEQIARVNFGHQTEKLADIQPIAAEALSISEEK